MWGRIHKHIAFKSHSLVLKCMHVLHSVLFCFYNTHTHRSWRQVEMCSRPSSTPTHSWPHLLFLSPLLSLPGTPASLLFFECAKCPLASGPLHLLFSFYGTFLPQRNILPPRIPTIPVPLPPSGLCSHTSFSGKSPPIPSYSTLQVVQPHSTLHFISLHNTYHPLKYILLVYLLIVSLLPLNINSMRAELFVWFLVMAENPAHTTIHNTQ